MEKYAGQYRLIWYISLELIAICSVILFLYSMMKLWYMVALIGSGVVITSMNLWLLSRSIRNIFSVVTYSQCLRLSLSLLQVI